MKKLILAIILAVSSIVASAQWYARPSSNATVTAFLEGRSAVGSLPRPSSTAQESGTVIVRIWVDNYGKVVKAQAGSYGTNLLDRSVWAAARNAAMGTQFSQNMDAPAMQEGTIKYVFWAENQYNELSVNKGAIKFLGIPIDGSESQFSERLLDKGFTYSRIYECYKGEFNGKPVDVYLHTNHGRMDRVYVSFPYTSEGDVKVEYNNLLSQFEKSGKYLAAEANKTLTDKDDISHEIAVNSKRFQASFHYLDPDKDPKDFMNTFLDNFSDLLTEEQLAKLKEVSQKALDTPDADLETRQAEMMKEMEESGLFKSDNNKPDPEQAVRFLKALLDGMNSAIDGTVWFMIHEYNGKYQIGLYYDNIHNRPHGEDL